MDRLYSNLLLCFKPLSYTFLIFCLLAPACQTPNQIFDLYVGTYTQKEGHVDGKAEGIYALQFNTSTGELTNQSTIKGITNPSYLTIAQDMIFAVSEIGSDGKGGKIVVFKKADDKWRVKQEIYSGGAWPCHIHYDESSHKLFVANYSGSVSKFDVSPEGLLNNRETILLQAKPSEHPRQESAHAHMVQVYNEKLHVADLGSNDVKQYEFKTKGINEISSLKGSPESGPRHFAFANDHIYILNELSNSIDVFDLKDGGNSKQTLFHLMEQPKTGTASASAIKVHPNQKFLYTANRALNGNQTNTIQLFQIKKDGLLSLVDSYDTGGSVPRDFAIDPTGQYCLVANQDSDNIVVFSINQNTGKLSPTDITYNIPTPVCLVFK